jgi:hypothetical protein
MAEKLMNKEKNVEDGQGQNRTGAASENRTPNQNRATDAAPATPNRDR